MAELIDQAEKETVPDTDVLAALRSVLENSPEPLTLSKIRLAMPARLRSLGQEGLAEVLRRQVAAGVVVQYPKYRSSQDRFWDRPMPVHLAQLVRGVLEEKPLTWPEIRRKLPDYAKTLAEPVLEEQVARGRLHAHPPLSSRTGARYGLQPPDPREFLRGELSRSFDKLQQLGFTRQQLREGAMALLQEEEWDLPPATEKITPPSPQAATEEKSPPAGPPEQAMPPETEVSTTPHLPLSQP